MANLSSEERRKRYSTIARKEDIEQSEARKDINLNTKADERRSRYASKDYLEKYNAYHAPTRYDGSAVNRYLNAYGLNQQRQADRMQEYRNRYEQQQFMNAQRDAIRNGVDNGNNPLGLKNLENPLDDMRRLEAYKEAYGKNHKLSYDKSQKLEKAYGKYNRQQLEQLKEHFKNAPERDYSGEIAWVNEKLLKTATGKENIQRQNILESQIKDADNRLERLQEAYADRLVGGGTDNGDYLDKVNQIKQEKSQLQNELNDYKELTNYSDQDDFAKYKLLGEANPNNPVRFFRTHNDEQANAIFDPTIRNEVDTAHHESTYTGGGSNQSDRALYRAITDEEADNYSYILGKYGQEEADKYLQAVAKHTDVNGSLTALQEAQEQGYKNPLLRTAESIGLGLITPVEAAKNLISGDEFRTYDDYKLAGRQEALRSGAAEKLTGGNEIGTFLYNTATSAADNLLRYAVGGGIGAATGEAGAAEGTMRLMMGGQVMDSAMKNALDRGLSDSQAVTTALISAVNEELFETISLSNLKAMQSVTPKNYRQLAKNIGKQFLGEGSEEMFTDIGNAIADDLVNGEKSEIRQNILNYMKQGMSEEEAKKQASVDFALQLVESGLSGGITGAAMGGAVAVDQAKSIKANQKYNELFNTYKESGLSEEDAVNTALSEVMNGLQTVRDKEGNVKDYKGLNKSIDKAIASAKTINENVKNIETEMNVVAPVSEEDIRDNKKDIRVNEVNNEYLTDMQRVLSHGDITTDAQAQQFLSDQDEMVAKYPDKKDEIIKATVDVYMKGKNNAEVFDRIASKVTNTMAKNETSLESKNTTSEGISQKEDKPAKIDFKANVNGEEAVITSVNKNNMTVRDSVGNETTIPINAAEMTDGASAAVEQAKQYGKRGSRLYLENMAGNIRNYTYTFNDFYNAGKQGKEFDGRNTRGFDTDFLREVYDAGVQDGSKASKTGGLVRNDARYTIQESEARVLDAVGKAFNVTIQMDHMLSHDANGYLSDGVIHISTTAEKPSLVVFSHEFTHRLEDTSPEAYKAYKDYVIDYLKKTSDKEGKNVYETREQYLKNVYASQGVELSDKELQDELVANATESFLSDTDFIEDLVKENKSLAQQILDVLKQMLEDLKNVFAENYDAKSKEGKALQDDLEAREEALKLWTNAIKDQDKSLIKKNNKTRYSMKELENNYNKLAEEYDKLAKELEQKREEGDEDYYYDHYEELGDLEYDLGEIVEQYAKNKGFTETVYHGTQNFGFTNIDTKYSDDKLSFFATDDLTTADSYSNAIAEDSYVRKVSDKSSNAGNYKLYANTDNMMEIEGKGQNWDKIEYDNGNNDFLINKFEELRTLLDEEGYFKIKLLKLASEAGQLEDYLYWNVIEDEEIPEVAEKIYEKAREIDEIKRSWNENDHLDENGKPLDFDSYVNKNKNIYKTRELAKIAKDKGYDGVIYKNIVDNGGRNQSEYKISTVYNFFNPQQQVKSADAVTYDDEGNVIPLSERFNKSNDDIRFSLKEADKDEIAKVLQNVRKQIKDKISEELYKKFVRDNSSNFDASVNTIYYNGKRSLNEGTKWLDEFPLLYYIENYGNDINDISFYEIRKDKKYHKWLKELFKDAVYDKKFTLEDYLKERQEHYDSDVLKIRKLYDDIVNEYAQKYFNNDLSENDKFKFEQFRIVDKANPPFNDFSYWIRSPKDIKTFEEAINEEDGGYTPIVDGTAYEDFDAEMINKALKTGKIKVYHGGTKGIHNGDFVTPSYLMASEYADDPSHIYSKVVNLKDVAWLDAEQGMYANKKGVRYSLKDNLDKFNIDTTQLLNEVKDNVDYNKWVKSNLSNNNFMKYGRNNGIYFVRNLWYEKRRQEELKDVHEISIEDAIKTVRKAIPNNHSRLWFVEANSNIKPTIVNEILSNKGTLNAGLNIAYYNYKNSNDNKNILSFNDWLNTPQTMYRGKNEKQKYIEDDVFISFTPNKKIASKFNKNLKEITIKPIDTYGSYQTTTEEEFLVPIKEVINNSNDNVRFSLKEDSEGRQLSEQQQEYFKDSKVRDAEGNLQVLYHQTDADFTVFDPKKKGAGASDYITPYGIFMKPGNNNIGLKGNKQMKLYANITNMLNVNNREELERLLKKDSNLEKAINSMNTIDAEYKAKYDAADKASMDYMIANSKPGQRLKSDPELDRLFEEEQKILDEWSNAYDVRAAEVKKKVDKYLKSQGYDGVHIIHDEGSFGRRVETFIAFNPNQVKNVDNTTPTDNPDIRFSLKEDSEGRELSPQQQEYFKDSKVVDENGNLLVMYHGTDAYKEFTIFKPGKSGYLGKGMYFSESKNYAERYAKQNGYEGRIYETYLNVKNPLIVTSENPAVEILGEKVAKKRELKNSFSTKWITPADIKKLQAQGYDGIIWKYGTTPIEVSVWDSNQIKSVENKKPTDNPDIRFSLKEESNINRNDVAALTGNNEYMAEAVNDLEETLNNRYGDLLFDVKNYELYDVFDEICKQYNIKGYSKQKFARNVKELFDYIKNVDHPDGVDTTMLAMQVAADMLDKGSVLDTTMLEMYPTLPEELRNKKIKISQQDRADLDGGYARFRRKYFGNLTLTDEGTEVDTVYEGLSAQYPELFPSDITHPADRLTQIGNVVDLFKRTLDHIQGASKEESAFIIAQDIINKAVLERTKHEDSIAKNKRLDIQAKVREQVANLKKAEKEIYYENIKLRRRIKTLESLNNNANTKIAKQEKEWEDYKSGKKQVKGQEKFYRKQYYEKLKEEFILGEVTRSKAKNRAERQATIDMIKNLTNKLSRTVLRPSENNYVPTYLLNSMIDVLQMIDLDSGYRNPDGSPTKVYLHLQNLKKQYEALRTDAKYNASGEDEQIKQVAEVIDRIAETVKDKRVNQLTNYELENLLALMKIIHYQINRSQELFKNQSYKRVADLSEKARENIKKAGREFDPDAKVKNIANKYLNNTLSPVRLFKRLEGYAKDGALTTIAEELQNGERESKLIKQTANDILKDLYETKEARKLLEEFRTKKLVYKFGEKEVVITPEMRVALYLHSLNEDNYRHIVGREKEDTQGNISYEGGGVVIPNYHKQKKSTSDTLKIHQAEKYTGQDVIKLTPQNIETIIKDMNEYDRMIVKKYKELNSYITDKLNDTTEELYGYKKATVKNYFPIIVDKSMLELDSDVLKLDKTIENMGSLKSRVNSVQPIYLEGVMDAIERQIDQAALFSGMAIPVRDFKKVWGLKTNETTLNREAQKAMGSYIDRYQKNLQGDLGRGREKGDSFALLGAGARGKMAMGALTGNLSVVMKQAASYPTAAGGMLGYQDLLAGLLYQGQRGKDLEEIIKKYTPLYADRDTAGIVGVNINDMSAFKKKNPKLYYGLTGWIEAVDKATVRRLWYASENYVKRNFKYEVGSDKFYKEVAKVWEDTVRRTQPIYDTMNRPEYLRQNSDLAKFLLMFKTQSFQNIGILVDAVGEYKARSKDYKNNQTEANKKDKEAAFKQLVKATSSQIIQMAVFTAITAIADAMLHRPKKWADEETGLITPESFIKTYFENYLGNMLGQLAFGDVIKDAVYIAAGKKYTRYDLTVAPLDAINDVITGLYNARQAVNTREYDKAWKNIIKASETASQYGLGVPVKNIENLYKGVTGNVADIAAGKNPLETTTTQQMYNRIYLAYQSGNPEIAAELSKNVDPDKIKTKMVSKLKEEDTIKEAAEYRYNSELDKYQAIVDAYVSLGFDKDWVVSAINSVMNKTYDTTGSGEYNSNDLQRAIDISAVQGSKVAQQMYDEKYSTYKADGLKNDEAKKKALSSVRSAITGKYKSQYESGTTSQKVKIRDRLCSLRVAGERLYTYDSMKSWNK